jgi:aconitate hydratase
MQQVSVSVINPDGAVRMVFNAQCRVDTAEELRYLREGGILPSVAKRLLQNP